MKTFKEYMKQVDKYLNDLCGMGHEDLPDFCYHDNFDDGVSAKQTAEYAYENALDY